MIGERIKRLREEKGYTITELARLSKVSKSYLSQIEKGFQSNPSLQFLNKISIPLETSINFLLEEKIVDGSAELELDEEWVDLIRQAEKEGLHKEDFKEYFNFLKYQSFIKEKKNTK